jgi:hypothetical protein
MLGYNITGTLYPSLSVRIAMMLKCVLGPFANRSGRTEGYIYLSLRLSFSEFLKEESIAPPNWW